MPLNEPGWWYGEGAQVSWQARALSFIASVYGWVATRRMSRSDGLKVALPVVCVGNFTAGGTGKNALCLLVGGCFKETRSETSDFDPRIWC